jgi:hypothetical protein
MQPRVTDMKSDHVPLKAIAYSCDPYANKARNVLCVENKIIFFEPTDIFHSFVVVDVLLFYVHSFIPVYSFSCKRSRFLYFVLATS